MKNITTNDISLYHKHYNKIVRVVLTTIYIMLPFMGWSVVYSGSISEGYPTRSNFPNGTMVSIQNGDPSTIEASNVNNSDYLAGVVLSGRDSLVNIKKVNEDIQVATNGEVAVYVSDINGDIAAGDFISASWISGVGMKARAERSTEQKMLGVALSDFNKSSTGAREFKDITTPTGVTSAYVGKIAVKLFDRDVGPDTQAQRTGLELLAARLAGKEVAFIRILAATGLFIISVIISGVFLANAIRGSFISLGRNPLASGSIFSSLMQVSGTSIALVLIGAAISYILLIL